MCVCVPNWSWQAYDLESSSFSDIGDVKVSLCLPSSGPLLSIRDLWTLLLFPTEHRHIAFRSTRTSSEQCTLALCTEIQRPLIVLPCAAFTTCVYVHLRLSRLVVTFEPSIIWR